MRVTRRYSSKEVVIDKRVAESKAYARNYNYKQDLTAKYPNSGVMVSTVPCEGADGEFNSPLSDQKIMVVGVNGEHVPLLRESSRFESETASQIARLV